MERQVSTVDAPKSPVAVKLEWAEEVRKRNEARQRLLESQHLMSMGRQIVSQRESAPAASFGFRATQVKKTGRVTWEEVHIWAELDPQSKLPGPTDYDPQDSHKPPGWPRCDSPRFDDGPCPLPVSPRGKAPTPKAIESAELSAPSTAPAAPEGKRPDEIQLALKHPRRPAYAFSLAGRESSGSTRPLAPSGGHQPPGGSAGASASAAPAASCAGPAHSPRLKPHARHLCFRELRDQMGAMPLPALLAASSPRRRDEGPLPRPHYR